MPEWFGYVLAGIFFTALVAEAWLVEKVLQLNKEILNDNASLRGITIEWDE